MLFPFSSHDVIIGHYYTVPITIESVGETGGDTIRLGGFDLLIGYGDKVIFMSASAGSFMDDCQWEYFTYRHDGSGYPGCYLNCTPVSLIRLVGIADLNNGEPHPFCLNPDQIPAELVKMSFKAGTQAIASYFSPINFYWQDCGDNALSDSSGNTLLLADNVYDTIPALITSGPPCGGPVDSCYNGGAIRKIDFYNGGVTMICSDPMCILGDINLDGEAYTVGDAVLFANFFIYGLSEFVINPPLQIAATDVNCDGLVLTVGYLVYMIRDISGDAVPIQCSLK